MSEEIEKYKPKGPVVDVDVEPDIPEPVVAEEEAIDILRKNGNVVIPAKSLSEMGKVGVYVLGAGVLRVQRGMCLANQQRVICAMDALTSVIQNGVAGKTFGSKNKKMEIKDLATLAQVLGQLSSKFTESQRFMIGMQDSPSTKAKVDDGPPLRQSFAAGEQLTPIKNGGHTQIVAQTVHITQEKP